ncbi:hypothetical protein HQ544_04025 [Candidatus Falkowbacteria bacterium]|nr:hypothetical protein [Candidatus Falkowbacteria bacterium]
MYPIVHSTAGILIAKQTASIPLAFFLALIFHFVLDFFPHDCESLDTWMKKDNNKIKKYFYIALADFILIIIMAAILFLTLDFPNPYVILAGIVGGYLPDFLWGVHKVTKWKFLKPYCKFHSWVHNIWQAKLKTYQMVIIQIGLLAFFLWAIIKL